MTAQIDKLFTRNRFVEGPSLLLLILYAPIGILLFILRLFISLQLCIATYILPTGTLTRKFILRVLYSVMGIIIQEKDFQLKDEKCRLLISNHVTPFDHLAVSLVYPCLSICMQDWPAPLLSLLCLHRLSGSQGREAMQMNVNHYLRNQQSPPLILYPEGDTTNGKVALMKYGAWPFDIERSVLVLGVQVHRFALLDIAPSVLGSSWLTDLFYLLFSPVTIFSIRYIGKKSREDNESAEDFSMRIQRDTAQVLGLQTSNHTPSDKTEYFKRISREEAAAASASSSAALESAEVHWMALQVKDILPHVPIDVIKRDIVRTRSIDVTVTNLLEGDTAPPSSPSSSVSSVSSTSSDALLVPLPAIAVIDDPVDANLNMAAKSFGKCAGERMQSFDERKRQLIAKARAMYIRKHGQGGLAGKAEQHS